MDTTHTARDDRSAVDKAFSVLRAFGEDAHVGVGVSELARRAALSKSTTFRVLASLEANGAVERVGTAYRYGTFVEGLGTAAESPLTALVRDTLTPFLADLYEHTRLTVQVAMLRGVHVTYLNKLEGHQRLRSPSRIGGRMPAYCTGVGKVLLADDPVAVEEVLRAPRHGWTKNTITAEAALVDELARVRADGVAFDRGESLDTLVCVAAPVKAANGRVVAALSVSGDATSLAALRHENVLRAVAYNASRALCVAQRPRQSASHAA